MIHLCAGFELLLVDFKGSILPIGYISTEYLQQDGHISFIIYPSNSSIN